MYEGVGADPSEFLNMYLDEDYSKPIIPSGGGGAPYDFLGAFNTLGSSSSASASPSSFSLSSPSSQPSPNTFSPSTMMGEGQQQQQQVGIDPALVGIPSPDHEFDEHDDEEDEEEEREDTVPETIAPIKVGGKGKGRKGTVASGGIKKLSLSLSSSPHSTTPHPNSGKENANTGGATAAEDRESDDWRPSPEEYKKMSSKEKRQLRNKISARNFRVRRKGWSLSLFFLSDFLGEVGSCAAIRLPHLLEI